jgi:CRISPR/Cas system-associated exonuclease Cas4 (RecB family)
MKEHMVRMQIMMRDNFSAMQGQMMDAEKALYTQAVSMAGNLAVQAGQRTAQLNAAYALQQGTHNNYATSNTSAVTFGPIYVNNQMDGAELIYKMQRVMDSRKPL